MTFLGFKDQFWLHTVIYLQTQQIPLTPWKAKIFFFSNKTFRRLARLRYYKKNHFVIHNVFFCKVTKTLCARNLYKFVTQIEIVTDRLTVEDFTAKKTKYKKL